MTDWQLIIGELSAAGHTEESIDAMTLPLVRSTLRAIYAERRRSTETQAHILGELFKAMAGAMIR